MLKRRNDSNLWHCTSKANVGFSTGIVIATAVVILIGAKSYVNKYDQ